MPIYSRGYNYLTGDCNPQSGSVVLGVGAVQLNYYYPQNLSYDKPYAHIFTKASNAVSQIPLLFSSYENHYFPTVMVDQAPVTGQPIFEMYMKPSSSFIFWKKTTGNSTLTNIVSPNVLNPFLAGRVPSSFRKAILARTSSPLTKFDSYSGSGVLAKGTAEGTSTADVRLWRNVQYSDSLTSFIQLDFTGTKAETNRENETGRIIADVTVSEVSPNGIIVTRIDSLDIPLAVEIIKNGETVQSFSASDWNELNTVNLSNLQSGDRIRFTVPVGVAYQWGYNEYFVGDNNVLAKQTTNELLKDELKSLDFSITAYPNPFNPQTTIKITLPELKNVTLEVYNMLGQKVQTLANGKLEAGEHNFQFNGSYLATGTYLYRLVAGEKVQSGKILLMK